jgi:hypothetical protein
MRLIETTHLQTWASSKPAESRFPYIVKALICGVIQPDKLRMPSGDAVWMPGYDGVLVNSEENRFVPTGLSVWELGTNADFKGKADKDYKKRSQDRVKDGEERTGVHRDDRSQITFVFVTPRVWKDKDDWVSERQGEGIWKDVVVIDGVDLQDWLEVALAVNLQFAAELGLAPEAGLQIPDQAWEEWSQRTNPPVSEELVVVGREEQEEELIGRLLAAPNTFTVRGDSPHEAWGFTLAVLRRIDSEETALSLYARTIVADDEEIAGRLRYLKNLIIVLKHAHGQVSGFLSSRGCHVIIPEGNDARSERNVIVLVRSSRRAFAEALGRMGLPEDEAERASRACGLSVTILQRQRAHANYARPHWADGSSVIHLLPALLAGRWNERSQADREILRRLANEPAYDQVEGHLQEFLGVDEPPIQKIGEMWTLTAPVDAFQLMARRLTPTQMERFKETFRDVFGRIDPRVEIPPDDWLYYDIKGERGHSGWLRSGMAEALLLIAERGTDAQLECNPSPRAYAEEVVRGLPGLNDDWRVLASLREQFARLMEAAPGPFLDSLERLIAAHPDDVRRLFAEGERGFGGGAMHTGLLWGLEVLAWSPDYLPRVALILARLARLDPGGRMLNRPINSLREIFLWWYPGTNATLDQRLAAIDLILAREPEVGWTLLANLLPDGQSSISNPTATPRWREFGDLPEDARTRRGQFQYVSAIVDRALDRVGTDPERWRAVLNALRVLSPVQQEQVLDLLRVIVEGSTPSDVKFSLWEVLRDFTSQHRTFQGANWALAGELVDHLEALVSRLAPDDPVARSRWLFDEWLPDLPSGARHLDHREQEVAELRRQAVSEVLQTQGAEGFVLLGTICKFPGLVAQVAVPLMESPGVARGLVERAIAAGESGLMFAGQLSGQAQQLYGEAWRDLVRNEAKAGTWPPAVIASLLILWPDERATWEDVAAMGKEVAAEYWRRKPSFNIGVSPEDQTYQIDRLIEAGRATEAFYHISHRGEVAPTEVLVRLFDATFDELAQAQAVEAIQRIGLSSYDVREFLDELRKRADLPREELARREYRALPLLVLHAQGLTIHEFMAAEPDFFVDVLCDAFLPAHRDKSEDAKLTSKERTRAQAAYRLLGGMEIVPGQGEGNDIDEDALRRWVDGVRKKAAEVDRAVLADQQIGNILAHTREDPEDGGWPHRVVRNLIDDLAADDIDLGLTIERHKMRGVTTKALYEGGDQERDLARQYRRWADVSRTRWPRIARVLEIIAQGWEEYGRQEDIRAEQDKLE